MALQLMIGNPGVDRSDWIAIGTCIVEGRLAGQWNLRATLFDKKRGFRPAKVSLIELIDGSTKHFSGTITKITERMIPATQRGGAASLVYDIEAVDHTAILARRTVTNQFPAGLTLYETIRRINVSHLDGEHITLAGLSPGSPGPTLAADVQFDHATVLDAFRQLSAITGYSWTLSFSKVLTWSLFAATGAAFDLSDTEGDWLNLSIIRDDVNYRNRQHVIAPIGVQGQVSYAQVATPGQWIFRNGYPTAVNMAQLISVTVTEGSPAITTNQSIAGVPVPQYQPPPYDPGGVDVYYNSLWLGYEVYFANQARFVGGEIVTITYVPQPMAEFGPPGPASITGDEPAEQIARAALTGGSGIWEAVQQEAIATNSAALAPVALGLLRRYARDTVTIQYSTRRQGLLLGTIQNVTISWHGLSGNYLIVRVRKTWELLPTAIPFLCEIECTDAEPDIDPYGYLVGLLTPQRVGGTVPVIVPVAGLIFEVTGGTGFSPLFTKTGAALHWVFADGTTADNNHPTKVYGPGTYLSTMTSPDGYTGITDLYAESLSLSGQFPSFAGFSSLLTLDISYNTLTGTLPSFATCTALTQVILDNNGFTGPLPSFSACTNLQYFSCGQAGFSGTLPDFSSCVALIVFDCVYCGFTGTIPSFAACDQLTTWQCDSCGFADTVLGSFATQKFLTYLSFAQNALTETAVNQILADLVASLGGGRLVCTVYLDAGTNHAPTGQGLLDKATLIASSWIVYTN